MGGRDSSDASVAVLARNAPPSHRKPFAVIFDGQKRLSDGKPIRPGHCDSLSRAAERSFVTVACGFGKFFAIPCFCGNAVAPRPQVSALFAWLNVINDFML